MVKLNEKVKTGKCQSNLSLEISGMGQIFKYYSDKTEVQFVHARRDWMNL